MAVCGRGRRLSMEWLSTEKEVRSGLGRSCPELLPTSVRNRSSCRPSWAGAVSSEGIPNDGVRVEEVDSSLQYRGGNATECTPIVCSPPSVVVVVAAAAAAVAAE